MKLPKSVPLLLALAALVFLPAGCATKNINPAKAQPGTGYVDFRAQPQAPLSWEVARFDDRTQGLQRVFSEYAPIPDGVLRLAFAPGHYRFRVTFLNRTVLDPTFVEVDVLDGMITPVDVVFSDATTASVENKSTSVGGTVYGRAGRRTKFETSENLIYRVTALPQPSQPYRPKQQVPNAH